MDKKDTKMYGLPQLSKKFGVPLSTLRKAAFLQEFPAVKIGERAWAATEEMIAAWLPQHRKPGRPKSKQGA